MIFDQCAPSPRDEAFLVTHQEFVHGNKGFGVSYWGEHWRFKLFDDLYAHVRYDRLNNLRSELDKIAHGDKKWISQALKDPIIM